MSDAPALGRLERIDLRAVWSNEATDFTPWLAREKNVELLGKALSMELEVEAQERNVGPFRADILCKDSEDSWVLIENQLERTDHTHLGQLLTYGAGLKAVTIIWIAEKFTDEHRAALDWLNEITDEHFRFFGLELELWRIGDSAPAPKFNIVSKPNEWSHEIDKIKKQTELTPTSQIQLAFWEQLQKRLQTHPFLEPQKPGPRGYTRCSIGRAGVGLVPMISTKKRFVSVDLWLHGANANAFFHLLKRDQQDIENEIGTKLDWRELPEKKASRIITFLRDVDPQDKEQWPRLHEWIQVNLEKFYEAFQPRVKALNPDDYDPDDDMISSDGDE